MLNDQIDQQDSGVWPEREATVDYMVVAGGGGGGMDLGGGGGAGGYRASSYGSSHLR